MKAPAEMRYVAQKGYSYTFWYRRSSDGWFFIDLQI